MQRLLIPALLLFAFNAGGHTEETQVASGRVYHDANFNQQYDDGEKLGFGFPTEKMS